MADRIQGRAVRRLGDLLKLYDGRPDNSKQSEGTHTLLCNPTQKEMAERAGISKHQQVQAVQLKRADVTYEELAKRLKKHGLPDETSDSIKSKLKRGTFAATFFLACLAALELEGVVLEEI